MKRFRERKSWIVLIAVLLLFAACKGETPTAPPPGGGTPPGGSPPPTGVTLTVTTSKSDPLVDTSVTITATASLNGAPVPDGTAVEFSSTAGSLSGSGTSILRTTTNGIATVTLANSAPGLIRVSATVNNVTRTVDVTFLSRPIVNPPPDATPTITSITPNIGRPAGGEVIRITGTNFKTPVHVLFDTGGPLPVEATVDSASETVIEVITPPINLGSGQELAVDVIVLTQVGSTTEQRVALPDGFTYRNLKLTPIVSTVTPNSGPVTGGTRVTIIGEGFQDPVQVLFNTAEARVLNVTYSQILVETPAARDTNPNGSGTVTGPVTVSVRNINSNTTVSVDSAFLYKAAMQITAISPLSGLYTGGTRVTIDGIGFLGPVAVTIGNVAAQVVSVTGTKVIILTPAVEVAGCAPSVSGGTIAVTNIANGDTATSSNPFSFLVPKPSISAVTVSGPNILVTVVNAKPGVNRVTIEGKTFFPTNTQENGNGTTTYTVPIPTNLTFPTQPCGVAGTQQLPLDVDVTYTNEDTGCTDTLTDALTVNPPSNACVEPPPPEVTQLSPVGGACADAGSADDVDPGASTTSIQFRNDGGQFLTIARGPNTGTNPGDFTVSPSSLGLDPGAIGTFIVTFNPSAVGARTANANFVTNDPDDGEASIVVCLEGNGI